MKRVLFLSKGKASASTRYRATQLFQALNKRGYETAHMELRGGLRNYLMALKAADHADIVVVLRRMLPAPLRLLLRRHAQFLVFDFDDAIFCNSDGSTSKTRMHRFHRMVGISDHIIAGNVFLASMASRFNSKVTIAPTCLDADRYNTERPKPTDTFDLVWIGSSSTKKYLEDALPSLREAYNRIPGLRLKIIADFDLPDAGIPTLPVLWSSETEVQDLASSHVGIAPMLDNDWTRGKCALKVIQYMATGLPVIASPAGMNGEIVKEGESGLLASSPQDWANAVARYAQSPELRAKHGAAGKTIAQEQYSIESSVARMVKVFQNHCQQ